MTTTILNAKVGEDENKIPDVSGLVRKLYYGTKISDSITKYFTSFDCNKFTKKMLDANIKEKGLVNKFDFCSLVKNYNLITKIAILTTKANIKAEPVKTMKFQTFDLNYFRGKSFEDDD